MQQPSKFKNNHQNSNFYREKPSKFKFESNFEFYRDGGDVIAELPLRLKIYRMLVEGYARSHIAKILKISPSLVAYHTDYLQRKEYVKRVRGCKSPILYTKGKNAYKLDQQIKKILGNEPDHEGWLIVQATTPVNVHRNGFKFKILQPATTPPPWRKQWQASGVQYSMLKIKLSNSGRWDGEITIIEARGKKEASITIWLPDYNVNSVEELDHILNARAGYAQNVANWLQKKFGYRLGIMEEYAPHIAIPVRKEVAEAAMHLGIKSEKLYFDTSPQPCIETEDAEEAITILSLKEIVQKILTRLNNLEEQVTEEKTENGITAETIREIYHNLKALTVANATIANFFAEILLNQKEGKGMTPPHDDRRDVV